MSDQAPRRPLPELRNAGAEFWRAAALGKLRLPRCDICARAFWHPRPRCPHCGSAKVSWIDAAGFGSIHTFTVVRQSTDPYFKTRVPYAVAMVELDEGVRLMTEIVATPLDQLRVGAGVRVQFEPAGDGLAIPVFSVIDEATARSAQRQRPATDFRPLQPAPSAPGTPASASRLSGEAAIVGAATAGIGWDTTLSVAEMMAEAVHCALADAGLGLRDVDGVFAVTPYFWMPSATLADQLGIQPKVTDSTNIGGASVVAHVGHALRAIASGACEVAVIAYASTQRSDAGKLVTGADILPSEKPYGALFPISGYAMLMQRHMHEFGTSREQLARVAVSASQWASLNPDALKRELLTVDEVLASPLISDPLRKLDICLVTNGGGAIVITSRERARGLARPPVTVLGTGESHSHCYVSHLRSFTSTAAVESSRAAYEMAGLGPRDIDVAQIYDAFTIKVILGLEDLGFCAKGEGGRVVDAGIGPGSKLPVNTTGGGLRYCHPGMFGIFLLVEAVRQLRGECGARQVSGARRALVHGFGGVVAGNATVILGRDA